MNVQMVVVILNKLHGITGATTFCSAGNVAAPETCAATLIHLNQPRWKPNLCILHAALLVELPYARGTAPHHSWCQGVCKA